MSGPVKIVAILKALPGKAAELEALLRSMPSPSRAEPGNIRYDLWRDQADPERFIFDELYEDEAAIAAHRETPHFQAYVAAIGDLAERQALVLDAVDLV